MTVDMTYRSATAWRKEPPEAEKLMWRLLRNRALRGTKFRREHPVGPFIVDFVCLSHRLVIELDGGQHAKETRRDERRTALLSGRGYRVLRFWNHDVLRNSEGVLTVIAEALSSYPSPRLRGEGGTQGEALGG